MDYIPTGRDDRNGMAGRPQTAGMISILAALLVPS
jgi:hypothetical protein